MYVYWLSFFLSLPSYVCENGSLERSREGWIKVFRQQGADYGLCVGQMISKSPSS